MSTERVICKGANSVFVWDLQVSGAPKAWSIPLNRPRKAAYRMRGCPARRDLEDHFAEVRWL